MSTQKNQRLQLIVNLMSGKSGGLMTVNKVLGGFTATVRSHTWEYQQLEPSPTKYQAQQDVISVLSDYGYIDWHTMALKPEGDLDLPRSK